MWSGCDEALKSEAQHTGQSRAHSLASHFDRRERTVESIGELRLGILKSCEED